ncbi:AmmeMemoRadiSam system protein B [Candidatus Parvarchaeota archaeon]|nr:AmmeMemoRadiSam system protein B [Candidatus Parvarchaeota archaeon]
MRTTAVAGSFYPSDATAIRRMLADFFKQASNQGAKDAQKLDCIAAVSPHAGYVYSGKTAAMTFVSYKQLSTCNTVVFVGPNHTGIGTPASVSLQDWLTPLGLVKCDMALAGRILQNSKFCMEDESAHMYEHSIEVQLPFLQYVNPKAKIVCICMGDPGLQVAKDLGLALSKSISDANRVALVASSDFTHYEKAEAAKARDMQAIKFIERLDSQGFDLACSKNSWSICGHGPITAMLEYAKLKGASAARLLDYTNSGDASGDYGSVVAYASIFVPR